MQICQELAKIYPFVYLQDGDRRHLEFPKNATLDPYITDIYKPGRGAAGMLNLGNINLYNEETCIEI